MAGNSTYGTVRHSLINPSKDVEIWYHYRPTRNSIDESFKNFKKINNPSSLFDNSYVEGSDLFDGKTGDTRLPGMYNLKLPVSIFGKKGFYTIYIKPKEIMCTIKDVGALAAYPDIRGIVIDVNDPEITDNAMFANDNLTGYRVEYFENEGDKLMRQQYYRLITSNNYADPVSQNLTSANSNTNGYRFNVRGSLCFITLTPSTAPSFKSNSKPYIGVPNQKIVITNTKFDPVMIEVEMCEHDIETLSVMMEGEQVRNLEEGTVIHYNFEGNPYVGFEYLTLKNNYNKNNIYEAKLRKDTNIEEKITLEEIRNS